MTPDVRLRPVGEQDQAFLLRVYGSTRAAELAQVPWTPEQKAAFVQAQFLAQRQHYTTHFTGATHDVILVGDQPAGRLYVHDRERAIHIVDIAILPEQCGKGVGTQLIGELIERATREGKSVTIHVERWNRAKNLYERLGFRTIGEVGDLFLLMERMTAR